MAKLMRKMLLLARIESVAGTDSVPTAAAHAMLVRSTQPELITAEYVDRANIKPYFGNNSQLAAGIHREITFEMEIAGAGTAGGTPAFDCLLRACAFAASTPSGSPGEKQYRPVSDSIETVTLYAYLDGIRWKMLGCVGNVSMAFNAKGIPVFSFRFVGEYQAGADVALPTDADYTDFVAPVTVGKVWTPTFSIHGNSACMSSLSIDLANNAIYRDLVGCGGPLITDRKPTGTAVFELPSIATYAWDEAIKNSTTGALNFVHGRVAGNIVQVQCPAVSCNNASITDQDGIAMLSLGLSIQPQLGNDEIVITFS